MSVNVIRKISNGAVTSYAGAPTTPSTCNASNADGQGTSALLGCVAYIAADPSSAGVVYYTWSNRVWVVNASAQRSLVAGNPGGAAVNGASPGSGFLLPFAPFALFSGQYAGYAAAPLAVHISGAYLVFAVGNGTAIQLLSGRARGFSPPSPPPPKQAAIRRPLRPVSERSPPTHCALSRPHHPSLHPQ